MSSVLDQRPRQPRSLQVPDEAFWRFSPAAQAEVANYVRELGKSAGGARVDELPVDPARCPAFVAEVEAGRPVIDRSAHFMIYDRVAGVESLLDQAVFAWLLGQVLGRPMVQNTSGWRLVEVYDRGSGRTIAEGARYHQTKQGSYMHNDAVNDVEPIDYLLLSCAQAAFVGGESVLVDAATVHRVLVDYPEILEVLTEEFWFEKRGMAEEPEFFRSPIIRYSPEGEPLVRYFRTYIEVAHEKLGTPLDARQREAFDFFDAVHDQSSVQYRVRLERGQTLVSADDRFLHTRAAFKDRFAPRDIDMRRDHPEEVNRYMYRMWSTKQTATVAEASR